MLVPHPESADMLKGFFLAQHPELMYMYVNGRRASSRLVGPVSWLAARSLCIIFLQLTPRASFFDARLPTERSGMVALHASFSPN